MLRVPAARVRPVATLLCAVAVVTTTPSVALAAGSFWDDDDSVHERQIEGLAAARVTLGCDPPANSRFCARDPVTRGQMAAFLDRTLRLPAATRDHFSDDSGSLFEDAIDRIAAVGITRGCNPPANDRYCPDDLVTREQMAAFLDRAFDVSDSSRDAFVDDDDSIFEPHIDAIAAARITLGCDPPANSRYCPDDVVRRGEMASFLVRADDDLEALDPRRLHDRVVTYDVRGETASIPSGEVALLSRRAAEALYAEASWNIRHRLLIEEVDRGGDFTLHLTDGYRVATKAPVCSSSWSCTVGDDIYINRQRFLDRPSTWAGRSQSAYQRYLVLHETGHFLDFDDTADPGSRSHYNDPRSCVDGRAPVMKQQSIRLDGCTTNVYPLPFERDCVEETWLADTTDQGDGDGDLDDECPHDPTPR